MPLKARNDIHLARRIWHFGGVTLILLLYTLIPDRHRVLATIVLCGSPILLDVLRKFSPLLNRIFLFCFRPFMRESERHQLAGLSYMLGGSALIILLFPRPVVHLSLMMFAVADPLASYVGIRYGRERLVGPKTFQGSSAAFAACFLVSVLYFSFMNIMQERMFIVCLLSALIGAFAELLPVGKLDDNFVFPVVSSSLLFGVFYLFGGL